jgi:hypothetical protein
MSGRRWSINGLKQTYLFIHECNLYCRPDEDTHCEVMHATDADPDGSVPGVIRATIEQHYDARLVECRPAPEIPPNQDPDAFAFMEHRPGSGEVRIAELNGPSPHGWLVWVQGAHIMTPAARAEWEALTPEERRAHAFGGVPGAGK